MDELAILIALSLSIGCWRLIGLSRHEASSSSISLSPLETQFTILARLMLHSSMDSMRC